MGLFSGDKVTTTKQTVITNRTTDARVGASDSGLALGSGAKLEIRDEFGERAYAAFDRLGQLLEKSIDNNQKAVTVVSQAGQNALVEVAKRVDRQETGDKKTLTDFYPVIIVAVVGASAAFIFGGKKNG